jgi:hypothetical protein
MRVVFAIAAVLAAMALVVTYAQQPELVPEGRGLLPRPAEMPAELQSTPPPHLFKPDPSGGASRTVFETDEDPNFKIVIQDFSFPPDRQRHIVTLPSGAFLHLLTGEGEVSIAKQRTVLLARSRTAVPAGAPIEVVNSGQYPMVVRALIVEVKILSPPEGVICDPEFGCPIIAMTPSAPACSHSRAPSPTPPKSRNSASSDNLYPNQPISIGG